MNENAKGTSKKKCGNLMIAWRTLSGDAKKPTKSNPDDAGFDLFAIEDVAIKPHQTVLVKTGIAAQLFPPSGWNAFLEVKDTSGNALKLKLSTKAGVIDKGYSGEIGVVVRNNNLFKTIKVAKGAKIAQVIPFLIPVCEEIEPVENLKTERGDKGYGSSGIATDKKESD